RTPRSAGPRPPSPQSTCPPPRQAAPRFARAPREGAERAPPVRSPRCALPCPATEEPWRACQATPLPPSARLGTSPETPERYNREDDGTIPVDERRTVGSPTRLRGDGASASPLGAPIASMTAAR